MVPPTGHLLAPKRVRVSFEVPATCHRQVGNIENERAQKSLKVMSRSMFTVDNERLWRLAVTTLTDNWQHDHTVPSRNLYPHQWSWDSGFIALGLARVAPERAW